MNIDGDSEYYIGVGRMAVGIPGTDIQKRPALLGLREASLCHGNRRKCFGTDDRGPSREDRVGRGVETVLCVEVSTHSNRGGRLTS